MVNNLENIIDMHIHSFPDIRERSHNDLELVQKAKYHQVKAIIIKSHQFPTVDRAWFLRELYPEVMTLGSITCNYAVGGLNISGIKYAIDLGARVIWLPTIDAANHAGEEGINLLINNELRDEVKQILQLASENNVVVGTGHISLTEIKAVAKEAKKIGFEKLVVTHPEFHIVGVSIEEQISLRKKYNVYFERTFAQPIKKGEYISNLDINLQAIKEVGYESTLISSDSGQIENPPWEMGLQSYIEYLQKNHITQNQIKYMTQTLPKKLLNI